MTDSSPITRRAAILLGVAGLATTLWPRSGRAHDVPKPLPHPDPRPGITGENVLSGDQLGKRKSVVESYDAARAHPEIFDGLYCACDCEKSMGHRSLLSCFESTQAVGCHSCREQAELVMERLEKGQDLAQIRKAFDEKWG